MDIRPIRTEEDYKAALKEIDRLLGAEPGTPEDERLDVLSTLAWAYEEEHYPIPEPDPIEYIKYQMESRGLSRADLEPYMGSRARVSEFLTKKRPLSLGVIRKLHKELSIPAEILIKPYKLRGQSSASRGKSR